jgi:hypothetical protein
METMLINNEVTEKSSATNHKLFSAVRNLFKEWIKARSCIRQHWNSYRKMPVSHSVPYRVWVRHGAYLEMNNRHH